MRIPRFVLSNIEPLSKKSSSKVPALTPGTKLFLSPEESYHLRTVLRTEPGQLIEIFIEDAKRAFRCRVTDTDSDCAQAEIIQEIPTQNHSRITLLVGMPKPKTCDFLTEKAVELGAARIVFFEAARTQHRLEQVQKNKRLERLGRIRDSALKQSYSSINSEIELHGSLLEALKRLHEAPPPEPGQALLPPECEWRILLSAPQGASQTTTSGDPSQTSQPPKIINLIPHFKNSQTRDVNFSTNGLENIGESVESYIMIGPEGGFSTDEVELAKSYGYLESSLGPNVLRTETAVLVACGLVGMLRA